MLDQIIRNIQIDLILGNPNSIIDTFNGIWEGLSIWEINVYYHTGGEFIYYDKNKEWVFYQDNRRKRYWCNYERYWSIFESKLNLNYDDIQQITHLLVENALVNNIPTPSSVRTSAVVEYRLSNIITQPTDFRLPTFEIERELVKHISGV